MIPIMLFIINPAQVKEFLFLDEKRNKALVLKEIIPFYFILLR
jgi:hypothetical protein